MFGVGQIELLVSLYITVEIDSYSNLLPFVILVNGADFESELTPVELRKISDQIADIWKEVGLELGLDPRKLNTIKLDHPNNNAKASLYMLLRWKDMNEKTSRNVLYQAIESCRANRGIY